MDEKLKSKGRTITATDKDWNEIQDASDIIGLPTSRWAVPALVKEARRLVAKQAKKKGEG